MPFGKYKDFQDCTNQNKDKRSPEAYCAYIHHKITGKWPAEMNVSKPTSLNCPICQNPVKIDKSKARLRCPICRTHLIAVRVRKK